MNDKAIEVEAVPESQALTVTTKGGEVGKALQSDQIKPPVTAAQAKIEAVANLTMQAYQRAGTLELSQEERNALQADFPDEAFQPGAGGKEHLIYIEHAHLRDRFNAVFGPGKWAIVPRNRWNEPFTTGKGTQGERVYVEAMLVVRGCFVGEAVGAMEYYPKNESQNYGDAVEGAKTAAFRRCAKEFGVGLQAWKKEWCEGWWARKRGGRVFPTKPAQTTTPPPKSPPAPRETPKQPLVATAKTRDWMIKAILAGEGQSNREIATEYFRKVGPPHPLAPFEAIEELPLRFVPMSKAELTALHKAIADFESGGDAEFAFPPHDEGPPVAPVEPQATESEGQNNEAWRTFPMPFGKNAGVKLEDLEKNYLFGLWANYEVEREFRGKPRRPEQIEKDETFRAMLDLAGKHYEFTKHD